MRRKKIVVLFFCLLIPCLSLIWYWQAVAASKVQGGVEQLSQRAREFATAENIRQQGAGPRIEETQTSQLGTAAGSVVETACVVFTTPYRLLRVDAQQQNQECTLRVRVAEPIAWLIVSVRPAAATLEDEPAMVLRRRDPAMYQEQLIRFEAYPNAVTFLDSDTVTVLTHARGKLLTISFSPFSSGQPFDWQVFQRVVESMRLPMIE